jgi:glycosyltransferase involved in cell wall biosynthesis
MIIHIPFNKPCIVGSELIYVGQAVVIPVYQSEQILPELYRQVSAAIASLVGAFEIIFVEDAGGDGSWHVIHDHDLALTDERVRGIRMSRNYGQHNALLCGIRQARYPITVTIDDDLQHPVSEIGPMLAALTPQCDVVYGAPLNEQHGFLRDMASRLTKIALAGAMGVETARNVSAFRVFRTQLRDGFAEYRSPSVSIDVLLTWATTRFTSIKVRHTPRAAGVSGYTVGKLVQHAVNLMTGFSSLPLQIASLVGFVFVVFGMLVLLLVVVNYLVRGNSVPGFTFLASMIAIFSGAQMFALGVFGEYLARIRFRSVDRPAYVIGEIVAQGDASEDATARTPRSFEAAGVV